MPAYRFEALDAAGTGAADATVETFAQLDESDMDIVVAASKDAIMMVEGEMHELQENVVIDALLFGLPIQFGYVQLVLANLLQV